MSCQYDIGDQVTLIATFRDSNGDLADPSAITFEVREPNSTTTQKSEVDASNPSIGVWHWLIPKPFDASGTWELRAAATAPFASAEVVALGVKKSKF